MRWCLRRRSISDRSRCSMRIACLPAYERCSAASAARAAAAPTCCRICCSTATSVGRCCGSDTRTRWRGVTRLRHFLTRVARTSFRLGGRSSAERTLGSRTIRAPMLTRTAPRERHLLGLSPHGFHRVVYYEWGASENPNVVVCVHGVGRNARDFDVLAETLPPTDAQGAYLTQTNVRQRADGRWGLAYDPGIAVPFRQQAAPPALWHVWDTIKCPTLVVRGAQSDMLLRATADEMAARGPRPRVLEIEGVGHAPMFLTPDQVDPVVAFLRESMLS